MPPWNTLKQIYLRSPVLDAGGKTGGPGENLWKEASLDWKPNAHKCQDRWWNPGLIGSKRRTTHTLTCFPLNLYTCAVFDVGSYNNCIYHDPQTIQCYIIISLHTSLPSCPALVCPLTTTRMLSSRRRIFSFIRVITSSMLARDCKINGM